MRSVLPIRNQGAIYTRKVIENTIFFTERNLIHYLRMNPQESLLINGLKLDTSGFYIKEKTYLHKVP